MTKVSYTIAENKELFLTVKPGVMEHFCPIIEFEAKDDGTLIINNSYQTYIRSKIEYTSYEISDCDCSGDNDDRPR